MADASTVRSYHDATVHGSGVEADRSRTVDFQPLDPRNRPTPFTRWPGRELAGLPRDLEAGRGDGPLDAASLARLLFLTGGVTRRVERAGHTTWFRSAMSAGNLHPVELYVATAGVSGVDAGLHHFDPLEVGLTRLREDDPLPSLAGAAADASLAEADAVLVLTGLVWRTAWKYRERGWRHLFWDAGAMLANLLTVAEADGRDVRLVLGFDDGALRRLVGADAEQELPLALVAIGAPTAGDQAPPPTRDITPLEARRAPMAPYPIPLPMVAEAHGAGDLGAGEVAGWREALDGVTQPCGPGAGWAQVAGDRAVDDTILQRGSTRLMAREKAPRDVLDQAVAFAARPVPGELGGGTLLEHHLSVHAVEGREPGAWRWGAEGPELLRPMAEEDARDEATHLCLDQPLGGDSAYTAFHGAEVDRLLAGAGPRAYRAAQLEAGVVSGRLALAAFALGCGATGLTFYDEEVRHHFAAAAAPMLVTSVGVPAYANRRGGGPGSTAELTGYDRLMERLHLALQRRR